MQMVFGNKGDDCATGVCFSRDPPQASADSAASSWSTLRGRTSSRVSGCPDRSMTCAASSRPPSRSSSRPSIELERHYRDVQDIEFTVEQGRLYLLQTRSAKRTAAAAVRAAVAMVEEGLLDRDDAIARIDPRRSTTSCTR